MRQDGTLSQTEINRAFPPIASEPRYRDARNLSQVLELAQGDLFRLVVYNEPSYFDALWDTPQENAEERVDQVTETLTSQGLVVLLHKTAGVELGERDGVVREAYAYDFEVVGFVEPPGGPDVSAGAFTTGQLWAVAAIVFGLVGVGGELLIAKIEIAGPGKGARMVSNGIFWLSLAAIAVSIAVIFKSAKAVTP